MPPRPKKSIILPHVEHELAHGGLVIGVDEVGRGPWAGPVVAAAVWLPPSLYDAGCRDSKQLKAAQRDALYDRLIAEARYGLGEATVEEIDRINILQASMLAMTRAIEALTAQMGRTPDHALIDGNRAPKGLRCTTQTIVKGDAISVSIAAASILAKVTRDRQMAELHDAFPHYGWQSNAGYGTPIHQAGLASHGLTPHHRRSFAPIRALMEANEAAA